MLKSNIDKTHMKLFLFYLLWWIIGVVIASIWGLGWFFLVETLRRIVTYFPPLRHRLRILILGAELEAETIAVTPTTKMVSQIMGGIIIVGWIGLTIFVFTKANISLIMILEYLQSAK